MTSDPIHCDRCRMTFPIKAPSRSGDERYTRCAEPGCGKRFWHMDYVPLPGMSKQIAVGVDPRDADEWRAPSPPLNIAALGRDENFP